MLRYIGLQNIAFCVVMCSESEGAELVFKPGIYDIGLDFSVNFNAYKRQLNALHKMTNILFDTSISAILSSLTNWF